MLTIRMKILIAVIVVATLFALGFCMDEVDYWKLHFIARNKYFSTFDILTWVDGWKWYLSHRLSQGVGMGIAWNIPSMILVPLAWCAWSEISESSHKAETAFELLFQAGCFILAIAVACVIVYIVFAIFALLFG